MNHCMQEVTVSVPPYLFLRKSAKILHDLKQIEEKSTTHSFHPRNSYKADQWRAPPVIPGSKAWVNLLTRLHPLLMPTILHLLNLKINFLACRHFCKLEIAITNWMKREGPWHPLTRYLQWMEFNLGLNLWESGSWKFFQKNCLADMSPFCGATVLDF